MKQEANRKARHYTLKRHDQGINTGNFPAWKSDCIVRIRSDYLQEHQYQYDPGNKTEKL